MAFFLLALEIKRQGMKAMLSAASFIKEKSPPHYDSFCFMVQQLCTHDSPSIHL